jgi:hypothetical protein
MEGRKQVGALSKEARPLFRIPLSTNPDGLETEPNLFISRAGADEGAKNPLGIRTTRLVRIR